MGAIDEEPPGLDRRQARQRHRQPVGVGQNLDLDRHAGVFGQSRLNAFGLLVRRREGVDAPDALVLVFLENGVGRTLQHDVGVERLGRGFGVGAGAVCDYLDSCLGHSLKRRYHDESKQLRTHIRVFQPTEGSGISWLKHRLNLRR